MKGKVTGAGTRRPRGRALRLEQHDRASATSCKNVPMKIAEKSFTADGVEFPAGSFVIAPPADLAAVQGGGRAVRADRARRCRRCRPSRCTTRDAAARRDLLVVERHAGDRLVALHVRQVRHPVRPDLQGAREARATCAPTTTSSSCRRSTADARRRCSRRRPRARCRT